MMSKQLILLILLAGYIVIIGALTFYHADNFSSYIHRKGDETIFYTWLLFTTSVVFQGVVWIMTKAADWKVIILGTIANFILSYVVGFGILMELVEFHGI
jgi:hypothetical protein